MHDNTEKFVFVEGEIYVLPELDITGIKRKKLDLIYAEDSFFQKLDLYLPDKGDGPFPLVVFIHGGGWRRGDKRDTQSQGIMKLREKGFAIASINWRLDGEVLFPENIRDCRAALQYLKKNAEDFCIDAERIAVAGVSAGGHLALMLALTAGDKDAAGLQEDDNTQDPAVQCAVAMYSITDLETIADQAKENEKKGIINLSDNSWETDDPKALHAMMLGGAINTLDQELVRQAGPINYIRVDMPPVLLQHGRKDFIVPVQQSISFYEKARGTAGSDSVEMDLFDEALHMGPEFDTDENMDRVADFIRKHMF